MALLITGAGTSMDLAPGIFKSGFDLLIQIIEKTESDDAFREELLNLPTLKNLHDEKIEEIDLVDFNRLLNLYKGANPGSSIDGFVDTIRRDGVPNAQKLVVISKITTLSIILSWESQFKKLINGNKYYFLDKWLGEILPHIIKRKAQLYTFNYDSIIEYAVSLNKKLSSYYYIVSHLYGVVDIGDLPFGDIRPLKELTQFLAHFELTYDKTKNETFDKKSGIEPHPIKKLSLKLPLHESYFLGFSFNELTCEKIGLKKTKNPVVNCRNPFDFDRVRDVFKPVSPTILTVSCIDFIKLYCNKIS